MVARLEQEQPELFTAVRNAAYLAYYESPAVIPAIQAWGSPTGQSPTSAAIRRSRSIPSAIGRGTTAAPTSPRTRSGRWI